MRVTGDDALRVLNRDFLGHDLSPPTCCHFPPRTKRTPDTGTRYFGDIAIAYPRLAPRPREGPHPVWAELQLLVVHGVLHLLGHDHAASSRARPHVGSAGGNFKEAKGADYGSEISGELRIDRSARERQFPSLPRGQQSPEWAPQYDGAIMVGLPVVNE